jgi:Phage integrase family
MTDRGADRAPGIGTHRLAWSGGCAWRGSPCALLRQRTQGTLHPAAAGSGGGLASRAPRTPRRACGPGASNARGGALRRDGVAYLRAKHVATARQHCDSLQHKRISPHVLRHTAAMERLLHGVDRAVIALWLGHESVETTQRYFHASLELQEQAVAKVTPLNVPLGRYRPDDQLLAFLKGR